MIKRLTTVSGTALYIILLEYTYRAVLAPQYEYLGYAVFDRPFWLTFLLLFLGWVPSVWMPLKVGRPSQVVYWFMYLMVLIPVSVCVKNGLGVGNSEVVLLICVIFITFCLLGLIYKIPLVQIPKIGLKWWQFWVLFSIISVVLYVNVISVLGFRLELISFYDVYSTREEFKEAAKASGGVVTYSVIWVGNVIGPFLISYGLIRKKVAFLGLGLFSQLLIYSLTGFKSVILAGLLIIGMFIALWKQGQYTGPLMVWGSIGLVTLAILLAEWTGVIFIAYLSVGRLLLLPGLMTGYYYDFFTGNPKGYMGDSTLSLMVDYPYSVQPQYLIGAEYFDSPSTQANANVWADGFAQFGFPGMVFLVFVLGIVLWMYDSISNSTDKVFATVLLGIPAITLANNPIETSLLTHGIGILFLIMYFVPSDKFGQNSK